jgi:23S rRNA (cytidine2498-2'-O)-methyltransferase
MGTAYLAPDGFERELAEELARADVDVDEVHGRLFLTSRPTVPVVWCDNVWFEPEVVPISSISAAARALRDRQRNWAAYLPHHRGRGALIEERLPFVSARPLRYGAAAPTAPLGSWTLLEPDSLLLASRCSSAFPNGAVRFEEDRHGPPSRAYLKLWEAMLHLGRWPAAGETALDLGASPGGWTWSLARAGAEVTAVDRSALDPAVLAMPGVRWQRGSAFSIDPVTFGPVDWLCCDVAAYPSRASALISRWLGVGAARRIVCTVKMQGPTDHDAIEGLRRLDGARVLHLHHNKHEVTFLWPMPSGVG